MAVGAHAPKDGFPLCESLVVPASDQAAVVELLLVSGQAGRRVQGGIGLEFESPLGPATDDGVEIRDQVEKLLPTGQQVHLPIGHQGLPRTIFALDLIPGDGDQPGRPGGLTQDDSPGSALDQSPGTGLPRGQLDRHRLIAFAN